MFFLLNVGQGMEPEFKTVGRNILRMGAQERALGLPLFSDDLPLDNPVVLKVLRSTRAHAKLVAVKTDKAFQGVPGLLRVFTAQDVIGNNSIGIINKDQPLLVPDKVRYVGDAVALIAAEDEVAAEKAADLIEVTYEDLEPVFDPEEALTHDAPKIHEKGNLLFTRRIKKGDEKRAFRSCAIVVERSYRTSQLEHAYLEPDAGCGHVAEDGTIVIFASTQNPHYDHKEVVELLGLDEGRVRVVQASTGGGFGSKLDLGTPGFIGLALYYLGRPVRLVYSREECFLATAKRHPLIIHMKTGADPTGRLRAMKARVICDTGAYGSYGIAVASRAAVHATGPYEVENVDVEVQCVYTNRPFCGAMRGFGAPQMAFAHESQMDILAEELEIDPLEIRRINALQCGSVTATGQLLGASVGIEKCFDAVRPHYERAKTEWLASEPQGQVRKGVGIGAMWYGIGNTAVQNPSTARIEIDRSGTITVFTGCAEIGQGSTTVLAQIAAETLGVSPETLRLVVADTHLTSSAGATSASRQTYISGNAVKDAAAKLADVLLTEAVDVLKAPKERLILDSYVVLDAAHPERRVPFAKLVRRAHDKGIPLTWQGYFDPETRPLDPETGQGIPYSTYAFACHVALVTVDSDTGEANVEKIVAAHDVGKAIHPQNVEGQIHGGVAMGIGFALTEEFIPEKTSSLGEYHIPTSMDVPEIIPIIIEDLEPTGPFGAKGVGEPALIPTAPAILNALTQALGERVYHLPANPEKIWKVIQQAPWAKGR